MSRTGPRLSRLGVLAPAALSACIDASVLAAPAAGAIVSTVLKELSKAFMLKKWFHGVMSAREAESLLLQRGKSGSYLVRESRANPGEYVLSVRVRGRVRHVMIRREQNKFDVGSGEIFDDLSGLIEHIRAYPLTETSGEVLRLRQPVGAARSRLNSLTKDQSIAEPEIKVVDLKKNSINPHLSAIFEEIQIVETSVDAAIYGSRLLDDMLTEEFAAVKLADEKIWFTKDEGFKLENRYKNRYREIVPYDQTRVMLPVYPMSPDEIVNNYINASYIKPTKLFSVLKQNAVGVYYTDDDYTRAIKTKSYTEASQRFERLLTTAATADLDSNQNEKTKKTCDPNERSLHWDSDGLFKFYIAAQGSLASTKEAYWSAIADNDIRVIAMLSKEIENGKSKSEAYWPSANNRETYGDLEIVNLDECKKPEESFITRTLEIYNKATRKEKILKHIQYLDWPDHNVPNDIKSLLKYIEAVNEALILFSQLGDEAPNKNILWVHCSAGIGRTGTFIALDILMDQVKHEMKHKEGVFPVVPATVKMIRWQRPGMVQNRRQYAFIYAALSDFIDDIIAYYDPNMTRKSSNSSSQKYEFA